MAQHVPILWATYIPNKMCWHLKCNMTFSNTAFPQDVTVTPPGASIFGKWLGRVLCWPQRRIWILWKTDRYTGGDVIQKGAGMPSSFHQKDPFSATFQGVVNSASSLPGSERRHPASLCCPSFWVPFLGLRMLSKEKTCLLSHCILLSLLLSFFFLGIWVQF